MITVQRWLRDHADLDRLDSDLLLGEALNTGRAQILTHPDRMLEDAELSQLQRWAQRRRCGEPLAYILHRKEFWSLQLTVSSDVLIPRPETELLVERALAISAHRESPGERILDLGTGSGAVAIALATELVEGAEIYASDVSQAALKVAAANAAYHNTAISWIASNWFVNISGTYHTIVSNPPYVAQADPLLAQLHAEPRIALVSGAEGLDALRVIVPAACEHLVAAGWLLLEHGHDQGMAARALMNKSGYENVQTTNDLAGIERVTQGQWPGAP